MVTFLRCIALPKEMADWSLTSLQQMLSPRRALRAYHVQHQWCAASASGCATVYGTRGEKSLSTGQFQTTATTVGTLLGEFRKIWLWKCREILPPIQVGHHA